MPDKQNRAAPKMEPTRQPLAMKAEQHDPRKLDPDGTDEYLSLHDCENQLAEEADLMDDERPPKDCMQGSDR